MKKLSNRYTRDVEARIAVLTESVDSGRHDDDPNGKLSLMVARTVLQKMLEDWNFGQFTEKQLSAPGQQDAEDKKHEEAINDRLEHGNAQHERHRDLNQVIARETSPENIWKLR